MGKIKKQKQTNASSTAPVWLYETSCTPTPHRQRHICVLWSYPLCLQVTFLLQHLTVSYLGFDKVLLGSRQEEAFRIHGSDDIIPNGAALAVVTTHAPWQILLYYLQTAADLLTHRNIINIYMIPPKYLNARVDYWIFTSGGCQSVIIVSTFICFLNSKCWKKRENRSSLEC